MTRNGLWLGLFLSITSAACGSRSETGSALGGESHFLQECEKQTCGDDLTCLGGVCTRECEDVADDCDGLDGDLICRASGGVGNKTCDASCAGDADCADLGANFACDDGVCRVESDDLPCEEGGKRYALGDSWDCSDGCNTCFCEEDGVQATAVACLDPCFDGGEAYDIGDSWTCSDGCNTCTCTEMGVGSTMMDCGDPDPDPEPPSCVEGGVSHDLGDQWQCADGCNTCTCTERGIAATMVGCLSDCGVDESGQPHQVGDSWRCDCNTCSCTEDGIQSTLIECGQPSCTEGGQQYSLGESWQCADGCNTCTCGPDGVSSTERDCPEPDCFEGGQDHVVGESWQCADGCNTCTCGPDGVSSTKKACLEGCVEGGNTYEFGDTWTCSDGCNSCTCTVDGVASTDAVCAEPTCLVDGVEYPAGTSVPSGDSCNSCGCQDDGTVACTQIQCPEVLEFSEWQQCEDEACLCEALAACEPHTYSSSNGLGSEAYRVCSRTTDTCQVAYFAEVEGGGVGYDCEFPRGTMLCTDNLDGALGDYCTESYQCNLLGLDPECPSPVASCAGLSSVGDAGADPG